MEFENMKLKYDLDSLIELVIRQVENSFFDLTDDDKKILKKAVLIALDRCYISFSKCKVKRYSEGEKVFFDPINSSQYTVYLYYLANTLFKEYNNVKLAERIYYLNKIMNGVDIFYEVELPKIMFFEHPVGTVLGRAKYKDKFVAYQNCTVGGNNMKYPEIGENVTMLSYSCILGDSKIGNNCIIASHTYIKDENIPDNSIVFGSSPNLIIKPIKDKNLNIFKS